jgi:hypothetical protein
MFDLVLSMCPEPTVAEGPFRMIGTILEANPFLGRIITGRIHSGSIKPNQTVKVLNGEGKLVEKAASPRSSPSAGSSASRSRKPMPATSSPLPACRRARSPTRSAIPPSPSR